MSCKTFILMFRSRYAEIHLRPISIPDRNFTVNTLQLNLLPVIQMSSIMNHISLCNQNSICIFRSTHKSSQPQSPQQNQNCGLQLIFCYLSSAHLRKGDRLTPGQILIVSSIQVSGKAKKKKRKRTEILIKYHCGLNLSLSSSCFLNRCMQAGSQWVNKPPEVQCILLRPEQSVCSIYICVCRSIPDGY